MPLTWISGGDAKSVVLHLRTTLGLFEAVYVFGMDGRPAPLFARDKHLLPPPQHSANAVATEPPNNVRKVAMYWKTRQEVVSHEIGREA